MNLSYKRISVIGGGNIGTQVACVCASKECDVTVYSSRPYAYDGTLEIVDANDCITTGKRICVCYISGFQVKRTGRGDASLCEKGNGHMRNARHRRC